MLIKNILIKPPGFALAPPGFPLAPPGFGLGLLIGIYNLFFLRNFNFEFKNLYKYKDIQIYY